MAFAARSPHVATGLLPSGQTTVSVRPLLSIYMIVFIAFIGYAMMVNFFPPLIMHGFGFLPAGTSLSVRTTVVGGLLAIYPLGQFFGSPVLGALSDRFGRKPVLIASLVVAVCCYALIALAIERRDLLLLGVACLAGGLSESNIAIAQSAIADITSPADRGRLFAYIYTACSLGYIAGPIFGGQIAIRSGYSTPFWIVTALLMVTAVWTATSFLETHSAQPGRKLDYLAALSNLRTIFTDHPVRRLYLINFLFYLTLFGYFRVIIIFMVAKWHMSADSSTVYYSYCALMSLIGSLFIAAPALRWFGIRKVAVGSALLAGFGMIVVVLPTSESSLWFTAGPTGLIGTLTLTACATLLSDAVSGERQGRVMGNNQALQVGAEAGGAALGGLIAAVSIWLPLVAFGLVLAGAGLLLLPMQIAEPA